ncbi:MAG: glycoside hydrolase domain-containing protein [Planctomycetota bacterium]
METVLIVLFVCDPLSKIFSDTPPPANAPGAIILQCARNEYESSQFAIRCKTPLPGTTVRIEALTHESGYSIPADKVAWNFVGAIPLVKNTPCEKKETIVRQAPCDMPDQLLADRQKDIPTNITQPVWLTVFVPTDAPAGIYKGSVTVASGEAKNSLPIELTVWPFALPDERHLYVTNWVNFQRIAEAHKVEQWSDAFWPVYGKYLDNMREHRQNIAWVPWSLIKVNQEADGKLTFDYALFDKYVEVLHQHKVADRIEITFIGGFKDGWGGREIQLHGLTATDRKSGKGVKLDFEHGMVPLLADLQDHLEKRGWLQKTVIHIADEPSQHNVLSWREKSRLAHQAAPKLKRIDAIEASDFGDDLEVWVPKLSHLKNWYPQYREAQAAGKELWYYICCHPTGGYYPNRFLDYPLSMVRVLHWINYAYDVQGYLHWGWCAWPKDNPFGAPSDKLPPGDCNVVYPGPDGPMSSLRWDAQRDSLEDFEYLWLLTERMKNVKAKLGSVALEFDPAEQSRAFCRRLIRDFADVETDPNVLRETRKELAEEIIAAEQDPPVIFSTRPSAWSELVPGPIAVEIHGAVLPGTEIGGANVQIEPSGRFRGLASPRAGHEKIELTFKKDGKEKKLARRFRIRTENEGNR